MDVDPVAVSTTAMMDDALAELLETKLSLENLIYCSQAEEDTKFVAKVGADAKFMHAVQAAKKEREAGLKAVATEEDVVMGDAEKEREKIRAKRLEMRAIIGEARRKKCRQIREGALSKSRGERIEGPRWEHFSLRQRWRAGEIGTS